MVCKLDLKKVVTKMINNTPQGTKEYEEGLTTKG